MANQAGIGHQLFRQRPDLVRRVWVPTLVGDVLRKSVALIFRLERLSVDPWPQGLEAQDPSGDVFFI